MKPVGHGFGTALPGTGGITGNGYGNRGNLVMLVVSDGKSIRGLFGMPMSLRLVDLSAPGEDEPIKRFLLPPLNMAFTSSQACSNSVGVSS